MTLGPSSVERGPNLAGQGGQPTDPEAIADWLTGSPMDPLATPSDPLPSIPGVPFLNRGSCALIVGRTGGGRSSLIQACLYDAAREGSRAAYLGHEVTEPEFNARAAVLATCRGDRVDDDLRADLARARYLNLASVMAHASSCPDLWVAEVSARFDIVAIDPLSAVASALDLDFDSSNRDFITWYDRVIAPITANGVAVVLIDNVGHASDAQKRAKGVSAKEDRADITFSCSAIAHPAGLILHTRKVRSVRSAAPPGAEWVFGRDSQRLERRASTPRASDGEWRPTTIMAHISELVTAEPGIAGEAIRKGVNGKNTFVDLGLRLLIDEGYVERRRDGSANRHYQLKPYLGDETNEGARPDLATTPSTVSPPLALYSPQPRPELRPATSPLVPSPSIGEGRGLGEVASEIDADSEYEHIIAKFPDLAANPTGGTP